MVGRIAHEELENWFNAADFIITGSHYEGSGVAIAEAMSCGCIPITTDFISFRKMTGAGRCGFMFDTGNESSLLNALEQSIQADREIEREKKWRTGSVYLILGCILFQGLVWSREKEAVELGGY